MSLSVNQTSIRKSASFRRPSLAAFAEDGAEDDIAESPPRFVPMENQASSSNIRKSATTRTLTSEGSDSSNLLSTSSIRKSATSRALASDDPNLLSTPSIRRSSTARGLDDPNLLSTSSIRRSSTARALASEGSTPSIRRSSNAHGLEDSNLLSASSIRRPSVSRALDDSLAGSRSVGESSRKSSLMLSRSNGGDSSRKSSLMPSDSRRGSLMPSFNPDSRRGSLHPSNDDDDGYVDPRVSNSRKPSLSNVLDISSLLSNKRPSIAALSDISKIGDARRMSFQLIQGGTGRRGSAMPTVEQILADRAAEAAGYFAKTSTHRHVSCQADDELTSFELLQGVFTGLRDELSITKEMMDINQKQGIRIAAAEIYKTIGCQLLQMEHNLNSNLNELRTECKKCLDLALDAVVADHQRYDEWLLAETEDKYTKIRAPLDAVYEVAERSLRKRAEESERLRTTSARLGLLLKRQNLLTDEEIQVVEEDSNLSQEFIDNYETNIIDRDEEVRACRFEIARYEEAIDAMTRANQNINDTAPAELEYAPEPNKMKSRRPSSRFNAEDNAVIANLDTLIETLSFSGSESSFELRVQRDPDEIMADQMVVEYEAQERTLKDEHFKEMQIMVERHKIVEDKWKMKTASIQRLIDVRGASKVLRRQERIMNLILTMKKTRGNQDKEVSVNTAGQTLLDIIEEEKRTAGKEKEMIDLKAKVTKEILKYGRLGKLPSDIMGERRKKPDGRPSGSKFKGRQATLKRLDSSKNIQGSTGSLTRAASATNNNMTKSGDLKKSDVALRKQKSSSANLMNESPATSVTGSQTGLNKQGSGSLVSLVKKNKSDEALPRGSTNLRKSSGSTSNLLANRRSEEGSLNSPLRKKNSGSLTSLSPKKSDSLISPAKSRPSSGGSALNLSSNLRKSQDVLAQKSTESLSNLNDEPALISGSQINLTRKKSPGSPSPSMSSRRLNEEARPKSGLRNSASTSNALELEGSKAETESETSFGRSLYNLRSAPTPEPAPGRITEFIGSASRLRSKRSASTSNHVFNKSKSREDTIGAPSKLAIESSASVDDALFDDAMGDTSVPIIPVKIVPNQKSESGGNIFTSSELVRPWSPSSVNTTSARIE